MMVLLIVCLFICTVIVYILYTKVIIYVNTVTQEFYIRVVGLLKASVETDVDKLIRVRIEAWFMKFDVLPLDHKRKSKMKKSTPRPKSENKKKLTVHKILQVVRTFKIKEFVLNIDTGNCITNAKLYPLLSIANLCKGQFNINFQGQNQLILQIENRPVRILKAFINN
ncbi:hypothetical protein GJ691_07510 [Maribacter sp. RZ05]|uniref:Uncharacterized protein n=1 Tax=Maribacter luteus TaxID=2594478 RepID=A0A6I2MP30_9FLAO|nr:hypothetical protein [Maribacter luteus]